METRMLPELKRRLSEHRFRHSINVAECAEKLAGIYACNLAQARKAALLHDNAKYMQAEAFRAYLGKDWETYGLGDEYEPILHAFAGALSARDDFGCTDEEILNAIRYHTTGRPAMTKLEQIIFISDYIESGRRPFDGLELARYWAPLDPDRCCLVILEQTVSYLKGLGRPIHPLTVESLSYYRTKCSDFATYKRII